MHIHPYSSIFDESFPELLRRKSREWRGVTKWPSTVATIESCKWKDDSEGGGSWRTEFSYYANGLPYLGSFYTSGTSAQSPFEIKDTIDIQFNPKNPKRCFYAGAFTISEIVWPVIILVLVVILSHRLMTGSFSWHGFFSGDGD
jgi:hypothetical protein